MITDDQITKAFDGYNFGEADVDEDSRRRYVAQSILKIASGYRIGRSMTNILLELGMLKSRSGKPIKSAMVWMYSVYHPLV